MNGWMEKLKGITLKLGNGLIKEVQARKKKCQIFIKVGPLFTEGVTSWASYQM